MYIMHVSPLKSSKWAAPEGEDLVTVDKLFLEPGARDIRKESKEEKVEDLPPATEQHGITDISGSGYQAEASGVRNGSIG